MENMKMKKEIKDYLHMYLGQKCRCFNHADKDGWLETISCSIMIDYSDEYSEIEGIVPILRSLLSMTEEEKIEFNNTVIGYTPAKHIQFEAESTRFLLSKGFDIFGLIDEGLAINKTEVEKAKTDQV